MENNESVEPESTQNISENKSNSPEKPFDESDLTDIIKARLMGDTAETETPDAENVGETPEVESEGVEDNEVLSQSEEDTEIASDEEPQADAETQEPETAEREEAVRGLPKGVKKRIDKLAAKRREAEEEAARLRSEVERLKQEVERPAQIQPSASNPYARLKTVEEIQREAERAKQIRRWCEMNPEGGLVKDSQGNETEYTAEEVRQIKVKALDALDEHLPAQYNYVQNAAKAEQVVAKEYPWWKDKSSSERQIAEAFLKHFPEITRFPDYKMVLGDYIRGMKSRESSKGTAPQRVPSQPRSSASPLGSQRKPASFNGNDDLANIIASRFI